MKNKLIVLGPSNNTRGGITSVIKAHQSTETWRKWNCIWIETYIDRNSFQKIYFFLKSYVRFMINLPRTRFIHIHFSESTSALRKSLYFHLAYLFKKKIILHLHAFSPDTSINGARKSLYLSMFQKADGIIALSTYWKFHIESLIGSTGKIKIIYNPCPQVKIDFNNKKDKTILFAGTLNQRKGYKDLIKAFSNVAKDFKDWKIIFAGNGEIEQAKQLAKELNVIDQVIFKGWVSGIEKDDLFRNSSIFCLPSYAEGFPMAVLDAWGYGIPVITTPVGGLPEIVKHKKNALVFEAGDINSLKNCLKDLMKSSELRKKIGKQSLLLSHNTFSIKNISKELDDFYEQIFRR